MKGLMAQICWRIVKFFKPYLPMSTKIFQPKVGATLYRTFNIQVPYKFAFPVNFNPVSGMDEETGNTVSDYSISSRHALRQKTVATKLRLDLSGSGQSSIG